MTLEHGHLTIHEREDKRRGFGPTQRLVLFADLIETQLAGTPFLVKVLDAGAVEFEPCVGVRDELGGREFAVFSRFNTL